MAPLLQSAITPADGDTIVTVRGDIDEHTALQLWQYLSYLVGQGHHHIVLDLRGMVLIDSAGVEILARVSEWTRGKGGELVLRSVSPALAEQLELARRAEAHRHHPSASDQPPPLGPMTPWTGPCPAATIPRADGARS
jgi:anti-sigma B factor antagonist